MKIQSKEVGDRGETKRREKHYETNPRQLSVLLPVHYSQHSKKAAEPGKGKYLLKK